MNTQEACEIIEEMIQNSINNNRISNKEFNALNKLLLEASAYLGYEVPDKYL